MNPARTFGPAVVAGAAGNAMMYLIYFVGPFLGAAIAVGAFRLLNAPEASSELEPIPDMDETPIEAEPVEDIVEEPVVKRTTRRTTRKS